jgi:hypothetical protein
MKDLIMLHGLGRTARSMKMPGNVFKKMGYLVTSIDYPSTHLSVKQAAEGCLAPIINHIRKDGDPIYFLTHSMGGIILRYYLQHNEVPKGSRAVLLAPPNHGSEVIDFFHSNPITKMIGKFVLGPGGMSLGTKSKTLEIGESISRVEMGVIIGRKTSDPWFKMLFDSTNDGKVSLKSACLPEAKDMLVVDAGHTFIMNNTEVLLNVENFFQKGKFIKRGY